MTNKRNCGHQEPPSGAPAPTTTLAEAVAERDELRKRVGRLEYVVREATRQNGDLEARVKELIALTVSQGKHFQDARWKAADAERRAERAEASLSAMASARRNHDEING